jgi:CHAT domain-containing protein/Tfp pilus assembly protein PilF
VDTRVWSSQCIAAVLLLALAATSCSLGAQEDSLQAARRLIEQAGELYRAGRYQKAIPLVQSALAIYEKVQGPGHPDTALALNNLAALYRDIGAYAKAEPLYRRALAIHEKALGPEHPDTATSLNNLAALYDATGAYAKAEPLYQRSLEIREKALGPGHPAIATVLSNLAALYRSTGAYAKAEPLLERSLAILEKAVGPEHPDTAISLNNLADLYRSTGAYAKAEPLYRRALAITEKTVGPEHPDTALALNNLAALYYATGAYANAEPHFRRALAIRENVLGPEHPDTAILFNNLALLYRDTGLYAKAEAHLQRALAITERALGPEHPYTALALNNLAGLYETIRAYAKAEPLYERAQRINEGNTARFLLSGSEARKQSYLRQSVGSAYILASFSLANPTPRATALGLTAVLQYKGRVLDAMSDSVARLRESVSPADRELFDRLTAVAQQFSTLIFRGPGNLSPEAYRQSLEALAQEQDQLETELSTRSSAFRQEITPVTLEGVRQRLPVDSVLVEWFHYEPFDPKAKERRARWGALRYIAYVLHRTGERSVIDLGTAQPIDELVSEFRTALSDPDNTFYKEVAQELFQKLIKPLEPHLPKNTRVLFSPDGALNLIPFAALVDEDGNYLTQRFEITYLTSGRDLLRLAAQSSARSSAVVMADPDYGKSETAGPPVETGLKLARSADLDRSGLVFTPLEGTAAEAKALQGLLKLDTEHVLMGKNATEGRLKGLRGPRILHVATHGFFLTDYEIERAALKPVGSSSDTPPLPLNENPLLRSGLALAGANGRRSGEGDDGILTAAEAAQLDLRGTQLVVLSACETGVGKVQRGEGVYGLRRALVLAGAQTQLASLWKVADDATRALMVDYYQRLLKGEGRSAALRSVQEAMLADPARQHPYYWAAFVPLGNWTPLPGE